MTIKAAAPPLGWVAALVGAIITGVGLPHDFGQAATDSHSVEFVSQASTPNSSLTFPQRSDAEQAFRLFAERPLLAEGRKPFVPAVAVAATELVSQPLPVVPDVPEPVRETPLISMLGTIKSDGRWRVLILDQTTGTQTWHGPEALVSGWLIVEIQPESVRLQLDAAEITLHLFQKALP